MYVILYGISVYTANTYTNFNQKLLGMNTIILKEYFNSSNTKRLKSAEDDVLILGPILLYFTFVSYSGFTLSAVVKEKEKNIKHLLYLSGNNMYCYWLGFFFVDIIKFSILIIISFGIMLFFYVKYYLLLLPIFIFFSFTITMFLYFFSFLINKEENAQKSYFILLFVFLIALPYVLISFLSFMIAKFEIFEIIQKIFQYFYQPYFITIAEITPMTSLVIALFRVCVSYNQYAKRAEDYQHDLIPRPYVLIITHCIYFIVEFFIWGMLVHLCEIGYLTDLWNKFLKSYCLNKEYEFSTEVPINDGFIIQENIQNYNTSNNNTPNMINNNTPNIINNTPNSINDNEIDLDNDVNSNSGKQPLLNQFNMNNNNNNILPMGNRYVQEQIQKVNNNFDLTTRIVGLTKTFCFCCKKNLRAVNNLYLGLEANEKFGLLGFNGSGKSTTFKCITNEIIWL